LDFLTGLKVGLPISLFIGFFKEEEKERGFPGVYYGLEFEDHSSVGLGLFLRISPNFGFWNVYWIKRPSFSGFEGLII